MTREFSIISSLTQQRPLVVESRHYSTPDTTKIKKNINNCLLLQSKLRITKQSGKQHQDRDNLRMLPPPYLQSSNVHVGSLVNMGDQSHTCTHAHTHAHTHTQSKPCFEKNKNPSTTCQIPKN